MHEAHIMSGLDPVAWSLHQGLFTSIPGVTGVEGFCWSKQCDLVQRAMHE